jgi:hypothetical protein
MKLTRLVMVALAAVCLTGCPDQDQSKDAGKHVGATKPHYDAPDGDQGLLLLGIGAGLIGSALIYRKVARSR